MKKTSLILAIALGTFYVSEAQNNKELDRKAINDMCGCYEITFKYTETFAPDAEYEKKPDYTASALELALPIVNEDDKVSIQHLLVINDSSVIKHWRQDWIYENAKVFHYDQDNTWTFSSLPADKVQGQWTQKVYQVDDSPRYSGSSSWVHVDGKHYWENKSDSPLPRREYSKRSDYNVMKRGNHHEITSYGWVHEQDNDKIVRNETGEDVLLAQEKGMNIYKKVDAQKCQIALDWWQGHKDFWAEVRTAWNQVYDREGDLTLLKKVDDKPLYTYLHALEGEGAKSEEVLKVLNRFVADKAESSQVMVK
ncbi:DUF6607 family protein [Flagellimonas meishanensis]|uniref:DUF6607 family protein n=1 Tax=Flagellimonas meishanensis TaxID=2873264 RepID=UPI001CA63AEA|nr:DUF6607 family protein [[Muricauda] meishanensis]